MFTSFSAWALDFLSKAAGHKYIRRIPYTSGGKLRYRYIYKVTHTAGGKHALHEDDVTVGAAFMLGTDKGSEVHAHVKSVDGDKVTVEYDDGPRKGEKETMSKRDLLSKLDAAHGISQALQGEREKQAKVVSELRASGASEKQIAREQARLDRLSTGARTKSTSEKFGADLPTADIELYRRVIKDPKSLEGLSIEEVRRLRAQIQVPLRQRSQWIQDRVSLALEQRNDARQSERSAKDKLELTQASLVDQRNLAQLRADYDAASKRAEEANDSYESALADAVRTVPVADPVISYDLDAVLETRVRALEKQQAEQQERENKGSKLFQELTKPDNQDMRAKLYSLHEKRRKQGYTHYDFGEYQVMSSSYNKNDALEIAESVAESNPLLALSTMQQVLEYERLYKEVAEAPHGDKDIEKKRSALQRASRYLTFALSESANKETPRDVGLGLAMPQSEWRDGRTAGKKRKKDAIVAQEQDLRQLREKLDAFYSPSNAGTKLEALKARVKNAVEQQIAHIESHSGDSDSDLQERMRAYESIKKISQGIRP